MNLNFTIDPNKPRVGRKLSDDRILELEQIPGENTKTESGAIDNRLFKGENKLHIVKDPQFNMWKFKMEKGMTPGGLEGVYTSFPKALVFAESYFKRRGVRIKAVIE
jgi:hypothetical protein